MDLRQEKTTYVENATKEEIEELNLLSKAGYTLVPNNQLVRFIKDSTNLKLILSVYQRTGETYKLEGILKAILDLYGERTKKEIREEIEKLIAERQALKKEKEAEASAESGDTDA